MVLSRRKFSKRYKCVAWSNVNYKLVEAVLKKSDNYNFNRF